jgi:DNA-binding transcriptional regulator of glucitol operon
MEQSRPALKFDNDILHSDAVSQAFKSKKADIEAHFNSGQV